ncbi:MAG TPA: hypothetical protein VFF16_02125 [Telluria sp.]|nr:hypothetical protein [Telluria sp.]
MAVLLIVTMLHCSPHQEQSFVEKHRRPEIKEQIHVAPQRKMPGRSEAASTCLVSAR